MSEYENVGQPKEIELSEGRFIEIARKKVVGKENEFLSLSKGEYFLKHDGSNGKRYQKNFSFGLSNGAKEKLIKALEEV